MSQFDTAIKATVKMMEARDLLKGLLGERYDSVVAPWKTFITQIAEKKHISPVAVACDLCLLPRFEFDGQAQLLILAATMEALI